MPLSPDRQVRATREAQPTAGSHHPARMGWALTQATGRRASEAQAEKPGAAHVVSKDPEGTFTGREPPGDHGAQGASPSGVANVLTRGGSCRLRGRPHNTRRARHEGSPRPGAQAAVSRPTSPSSQLPHDTACGCFLSSAAGMQPGTRGQPQAAQGWTLCSAAPLPS